MPSRLTRSQVDLAATQLESSEPPPPPTADRGGHLMQVAQWSPDPGGDSHAPGSSEGGGVSAARLSQGLTARSVLEEVDGLLASRLPAGLGVSENDAAAALGLINALTPAEQREVLTALGRDRRLGTLADHLPTEGKAQLVEVAVGCGLIEERPGELAAPRSPQPPDRPALLNNQPSLPGALRELVHAENQRRARVYERQFGGYVASYCEAAKQAAGPSELRALGPLSTPPSLLEPGITADDQKFRHWNSALLGTGQGESRALRAVSDRISDFRGEVHAGGFSLGLDFTAKGAVGPLARAVTLSTSVSDDGRALAPKLKDKIEVELKAAKGALSAEITPEGQLASLKAAYDDTGVELSRTGKVTLSTKVHGVTVSTFADPGAGASGLSVGRTESAEFMNGRVKLAVSAKATLTAQGIKREYYADIGGRQEGVFGPMPELDAGVAFAALPKERQQWYGRHGFTQAHWPGTSE